MVLVLLPVIIGAAVVGIASGAQYGDYAAAKMPQYGSDEYRESVQELISSGDDYHDRAHEVPASPDYKYEEDLNFRTVNIENDEDVRKPTKKPPKVQPSDVKPPLQQSNKAITKFKPSFHTRSKPRNSDRNFELNKNSVRSGRIRSNDIIDKEDDFIRGRYQDRFENEKIYTSGTRDRVVRRKPRDRSISIPEIDIEDIDDDDDDEGKSEHENVKETDYSASEESVIPGEIPQQFETKERNVVVKLPSPVPGDDILARLEAKKLDQKTEEEYQDYYDMKRVNSIKKKITVLYRRTKARATGSTTSRRVQVWTYRRSYVLDRYGTPKSSADSAPNRTKIKTKKKNKTKTRNINRKTKDYTSPSDINITTRVAETTANAENKTTNAESISSLLSLAEKSRLSILKKAQLKESLMNKTITVKPPVLMQVSQRMNTMVMVEPQNKGSNMQLMDLGSQMSDTPVRLAHAKKIMRRKLVAGARSIQDLTDKWDEMVCDYLDVSQLDCGRKNLLSGPLILLFIMILQLLQKRNLDDVVF